MNANEILKKHEDANEMHFHEVDREWIIEAMEEYAALRQPLVMGSLDWFSGIPEIGRYILFVINGEICHGEYSGNNLIIIPDLHDMDTDRYFEYLSNVDKWTYFDSLKNFL